MTDAGNATAPPRRFSGWPPALITAAAIFALYFFTAAPCAWWGDGMELATAAWTLGVPHPTGYPLYMVAGYIWMHALGWMDPGRALTLFSAACLSAGTGVLLLIFLRVIGFHHEYPRRWILLCALTVATARTVWEHATFAEVYPLTFLLGTLLIYACWKVDDSIPTPAGAAVLGFFSGMLALNHYSGLAFAPLVLLILMKNWPRCELKALCALTFVGVFFICLCGYLYLPVRAAANPPLNWGDPSNWERFLWTLRGGQFGEFNIRNNPMRIIYGIGRWLDWWKSQWFFRPTALSGDYGAALLGTIPAGAGLWGLAILARQRRTLGMGLMLCVVATLVIAAIYDIPDIDAYFLPAIPAAAIGWVALGQWLADRTRFGNYRSGVLAVAVAIIAAAGLVQYPWVNKAGDREPLAWSDRVMNELPPDSVVLTFGDHAIFALWYRQIVLEKREDVTILGTNFIFSGWYAKYFDRPGRPRRPLTIEQRPVPPKIEFDLALLHGNLLPIFRNDLPVYSAYFDPVLMEYFNPELAAPLLTVPYLEWIERRYEYLSLSPHLYKLERNPRLESMGRNALAWELRSFYAQQQRQGEENPQ